MASATPENADQKTPKLRADARRNRDKLIEIAAQAFADNGVETSLEDIARKAGVGIGTLYRHFPTREHLVEVVYRRELQNLADAADDLSRTEAADIALEQWMRRFVSYMATKRGMASSLKIIASSNSTMFAEGFGRIRSSFDTLLTTAQAQGLIRKDIGQSDLMHAMSSIYSIPDTPEWRDSANRLIGLLMDGMRVQR